MSDAKQRPGNLNNGAIVNPQAGCIFMWAKYEPSDLDMSILQYLTKLNDPRMPVPVAESFAAAVLILQPNTNFTPFNMKSTYQLCHFTTTLEIVLQFGAVMFVLKEQHSSFLNCENASKTRLNLLHPTWHAHVECKHLTHFVPIAIGMTRYYTSTMLSANGITEWRKGELLNFVCSGLRKFHKPKAKPDLDSLVVGLSLHSSESTPDASASGHSSSTQPTPNASLCAPSSASQFHDFSVKTIPDDATPTQSWPNNMGILSFEKLPNPKLLPNIKQHHRILYYICPRSDTSIIDYVEFVMFVELDSTKRTDEWQVMAQAAFYVCAANITLGIHTTCVPVFFMYSYPLRYPSPDYGPLENPHLRAHYHLRLVNAADPHYRQFTNQPSACPSGQEAMPFDTPIMPTVLSESVHSPLKRKVSGNHEEAYVSVMLHNSAHMDIKPDNLVLNIRHHQRTLKIIDFHLSIINANCKVLFGRHGTEGYMAPKVQAQTSYYPMLVDRYSCGVCILEVLQSQNSLSPEKRPPLSPLCL
ncbi:hypothetical protein BT96DRAFT_943336 [Gymnopus androsaceus JB14]|uniref:Protein kinase domain-containing protein n=1 Tax=Gymnopus androsaceus JB14 TaxID=1447944 RepID=A0A6A4H7H5_9AGAR|nr:hypothetical protein BT96DRAFT_943336 [Gymnopus androsaceus JB14]